MIGNAAESDQALEQLQRMYRALAALRRDVYPVNAERFALLAEGPYEGIDRLQADVDEFTGRADRAGTRSESGTR